VKVLFGQAYYLRFDPKLWRAMQPYPPLGTLYAASWVRARGHDVALFDAMLAASEAEWEAALDRHMPHVAVLYEDNFNYLSKMCLLRMRQAGLAMVAAARARGATVIVCGADASDHPDLYLAAGADFVIVGEGEETLGELLDRLSGRRRLPLAAIRGLAFKPTGAEVMHTAPRPVLRDLDDLPFPAWDLVDVARYRRIWHARHGYYSMNMVTTRGCPYHCSWCAKPVWGQQYHSRSPDHAAAELAWLVETYRPDHIWFADDILGLKPGWLPRFADAVEQRGVRVPFKCLTRADLVLRDGEVDALARAGCQVVWLGAESGSQRVLDAMEKGIRVEQIREAARRLHASGLQVGFFLQFGYPGETRADIDETIQLVRDCAPDDIGVSVSYPLPGTPFFDRVRATLGGRQNWVDSSDLAMLYRGPFTTAFYRQLHRVVHHEFRARKRWRELRCRAGRPADWRPADITRAGELLRHAMALPYARKRLERLALAPYDGIGALPYTLSPERAAQPTAPEPNARESSRL